MDPILATLERVDSKKFPQRWDVDWGPVEILQTEKSEAMQTARAGSLHLTPRFAVRRVAWHALDHAWEIEDRRG
jgi:hypothetical protein